jgi:hypothetical protein
VKVKVVLYVACRGEGDFSNGLTYKRHKTAQALYARTQPRPRPSIFIFLIFSAFSGFPNNKAKTALKLPWLRNAQLLRSQTELFAT